MNLVGNSLRVVTSAAVATDVFASWTDVDDAGARASGNTQTAITTATTTTIVAAPGVRGYREVQSLTMRNKGAASQTVTLQVYNGTTANELYAATLAPNDTLTYSPTAGFDKINTAGSKRSVSTTAQSVGASVTAAVLAGSSLSAAALQVGTVFRWTVALTKTAAATASMTFDVRVGTVGDGSDTSRATLATGTQSAVVDSGTLTVLLTVRGPISASCITSGSMSLVHNLAATGFGPTADINGCTDSSAFDITPAGTNIYLSLTTGASHAITICQVFAERIDP